MAEHGFTPGPWYIDATWDGEKYIRDQHGGQVLVAAWEGGSQTDLRMSDEDARLIAASPTLLEALEGVIAELEEMYCATADTKADAKARLNAPCLIAARAAIQLATGEPK